MCEGPPAIEPGDLLPSPGLCDYSARHRHLRSALAALRALHSAAVLRQCAYQREAAKRLGWGCRACTARSRAGARSVAAIASSRRGGERRCKPAGWSMRSTPISFSTSKVSNWPFHLIIVAGNVAPATRTFCRQRTDPPFGAIRLSGLPSKSPPTLQRRLRKARC